MICRGLALNSSRGQNVLRRVWRGSGRFVFWSAMNRGGREFSRSCCTGAYVRAVPSDCSTAKGNTGSSGSVKASAFGQQTEGR